MKIKGSFSSNMFNYAITPLITVWRNYDGGFGGAIHVMRWRAAFYTSKR